MLHAAFKRLLPWLACAGLVAPALPADASKLEGLLRAQRPDVSRWQWQPLDRKSKQSIDEVVELGRVGARTPVRFADGRVHWYSVAGFREVLVSAHPLEGGATLQPQDARLEERDVIALGCEAMLELAPEARWRARRRLAAGEVLCNRTIESAPQVSRDHAVTLSARRGGIQVSRVLVAANDARLGERVRLNHRASGTTVIGIVTGAGTARLPEEQE